MNVVPVREADHERVLAMLRADEELLTGSPSKIGMPDIRAYLAGVDAERDTWLFDDDGAVAAMGWVEQNGEIGIAIGVVAPSRKGTGLGGQLIARAEARHAERGAKRIHQIAFAVDPAAAQLLAAHGYDEVRRFYEMAIVHDAPPAEPSVPDGFTIETFTADSARAFHEALDESFLDHWESHSRAFDEWWEQRSSAEDFDPTLWFLVREGDEVAAVVRNDPNRSGGGWVGALGVRRPWRGRGLGRALLLHTFGEFYRRGVPRVGLGVDSENPTGATRLYESVGMTVELEQVVYEKTIA